MIAFLRGYVAALYEGTAVIDVGGVGYEVRVAGETVQRLAAAGRDEEVLVYTYTYLREDQIALYGFGSREDLELFKLLITVSGIGPKGGLVYVKNTVKTIRVAKGEAGTSVNPQKASARMNPQKASARNR